MKPLLPQRADYQAAATLLVQAGQGLLSTQSKAHPGFPFGSLTPYQLSPEGTPVVWISALAQHSQNLLADPQVCLTCLAEGPSRDRARLSLLSLAQRRTEDMDLLRRNYLTLYPEAQIYLQLPDFAPFELVPQQAYYIGGFGKALWLEVPELLPQVIDLI
ncbi:MAG: pyridoxamine 5'-phosphate oxidase family protein [bacterium]|nr:pyridoxamine 5'-phosphate oxidase family protein [bacterium]